MAVLMRLISLILIVAALMLLGADAVTRWKKAARSRVRSLGTVWALIDSDGLDAFKSWVTALSARSWRRVFIPPWRCRAGPSPACSA